MTDTCVCCGAYVPEGRMICPNCEQGYIPQAKDKKSAILDYLKENHTGKRHAVHSAELERLFSLDDRAVRRKVSALRKEGHPICSGDMGYYYAESQREINATVGRLNDMVTGVSNARTGLLLAQLMKPTINIEVMVRLEDD